MSNSNGSNGQKPSDVNHAQALLQKLRGSAPESMISVLERLASQFDLMFSGHPGTGVANPAPAAPPSVDPIPSEWDAAFNGSIPPVPPITAPSANDPKTPPDWHLTAHLTPAETSVHPAQDIACSIPITDEEWELVKAHREKEQAARSMFQKLKIEEEAFNQHVIGLLEVAIKLYKECYVPPTEDRRNMFVSEGTRFNTFCEIMKEKFPAFAMVSHDEKGAIFGTVIEIVKRAIFECDSSNGCQRQLAWIKK